MGNKIFRLTKRATGKFFTKESLLSRKKRVANEIPITKVKKLDNKIILVTFNF